MRRDGQPIESYVRRLSMRLWLFAPMRRRAILGEVEGHLREAARDLMAQGAARLEAEEAAVERFGRYPLPVLKSTLSAIAICSAVLIVGVLVATQNARRSRDSQAARPRAVTVPGRTVAVPNVAGVSVLAAAARLQRAGFTVTVPEFHLSSQTPPPVVTGQSPSAGRSLTKGKPVVLRLGYPCCAGSPAVGIGQSLVMPDVGGERLDQAIRRMRQATGFFAVSVPASAAIRGPLLRSFRVGSQWPAPGFDLLDEKHPFRLPSVTAATASA